MGAKAFRGQVITIKVYTHYQSPKCTHLIKLHHANVTVLTSTDMAVMIQIAL